MTGSRHTAARFLATLVAVMVTLAAGCAVDATSRTAPSGPVVASSESAREGYATVDRTLLPTVKDMAFTSDKVSVKVPSVPTLRTLTAAMAVVRGQYLRDRGADTGSFTLDWTPIGSSLETIGVQLIARSDTDKGPTTRITAVWFDNRTNRAVASPGLVRPGYWEQFSDRVQRAASARRLDPNRVAASLRDQAAPLGTGPALGFAKSGDLIVTFPGRTVTDGGEAVSLTIPGADAVLLLNEFGLRSRTSAMSPVANSVLVAGPMQPDPDLPSPSPSPTPARTPQSASPSPAQPAVLDDRPNTQVTPDCRRNKCVALTFDDGPTNDSLTIVRHLQAARVGATFFALGDVLKKSTAPLSVLAGAGMEVGSHTWQHVSMTGRTDAEVKEQLTRNADVIEQVTGVRPLIVRPPYGAKDARVAGLVGAQGAAIVNWSIDTLDWQTRDTAKTVAAATGNPSAGDIILMHDIYPTTAAAVPDILANLSQKGFTVVPVSELAPPGSFQAGVSYCSSPLRKNAKC